MNNQPIKVSPKTVLKATGVKSLSDIPQHIHIVTTRWLSSGKLVRKSTGSTPKDGKGKAKVETTDDAFPVMSDEEKEGYAVFPERLDGLQRKNTRRTSLQHKDSGTRSLLF